MLDLFLRNMQLLSFSDVNWTGVVWIIVMFLQLFGLSFWRHPFTAEHPLLSSDAILHFSKSDEETNYPSLDG